MFPWNFFPFNKDTKKMLENLKPGEIEKYAQDMMNKMLGQQMQNIPNSQEFLKNLRPHQPTSAESGSRGNPLQPSIFETHDYVFVMLPIEEEWLSSMRLYHTSNRLIIEHVPKPDDKQTFTLPAIVKKKGTTACLKDGLLEIRLSKNTDMNYSEIDVTEKL